MRNLFIAVLLLAVQGHAFANDPLCQSFNSLPAAEGWQRPASPWDDALLDFTRAKPSWTVDTDWSSKKIDSLEAFPPDGMHEETGVKGQQASTESPENRFKELKLKALQESAESAATGNTSTAARDAYCKFLNKVPSER